MPRVPADDDSVVAYAACRDLRALYETYQASARAHAMVLARMAAGEARSPRAGTEAWTRNQQVIARRHALARESDLVYGLRAEQLRRRLLEIRDLPDLS